MTTKENLKIKQYETETCKTLPLKKKAPLSVDVHKANKI